MKDPLVSVVMTVYNCERFIKQSLESIFDQTFQNFELIIYNDASTDKTWQKVLAAITDKNKEFMGLIHLIPGKKNVGCGEGRNRAINRARGKYIAIQDADDVSLPERLEKEVEFLEKENIFCVGSWADRIDEENNYIETLDYPFQQHKDIVKDIVENSHNSIIDPSSMFNRDIFNKLGRYDNKWNLIPDFHLWIKAILAGHKIGSIAEKLVLYRKHGGSVMANYEREAIRQHVLLYNSMVIKHKKRFSQCYSGII